jgi:NAD(P)-dependent dehydrogenase (short-subunit alcohol dehydrogenase family)
LNGRRVLVAGGSGELGSVIARDLAAAGYLVAVHCHRRRDVADAIASELPNGGHAVVQADLADAIALDAALAELSLSWGGLDDVVNCAWPAVPSRTVEEFDDSALDAALLGARGHAHLCRAVVPALRRSRGSLVFVGGALSTRLHPGLGLFGAGKSAATVITHVLALEEGGNGVRANVVSPGRVAVEAGDLAESDPAFASLDEIGELRRALPLPTAADIAASVRWLLADESRAVTGQTLTLAGGERV